jgi:DNA-binding response OmpR family regulator
MASVLVIEDEFNIRMFVTVNLEARGFTVYEAGSGYEGLELLRKQHPSVLILDVLLPDLTGWDILAEMEQEETLKQIPVIMMTASVGIPQPNVIYPNVVQKLIKPVSVDHILKAVDAILQE